MPAPRPYSRLVSLGPLSFVEVPNHSLSLSLSIPMTTHSTPSPLSAESLRGSNLYLVGMMGAGKTTVGKRLAAQLGYRFFDTDAVIEQSARQSIANIFATSGEAAFRELETEVLGQLSGYTRLAIATGGGIVLQRKNWSYLHHGIVVWLDVSPEQLYDRLKEDTTRPLLQAADPQETLRSLLEQRRSLYAQADVRVTVQPGETPEEITNRVLLALQDAIQPAAIAADLN